MDVRDLGGVVAILPTPLLEGGGQSGDLDLPALRHLVHHCDEAGLDGAAVLGSNGEYPYLTFDEKCRAMAAAATCSMRRVCEPCQ